MSAANGSLRPIVLSGPSLHLFGRVGKRQETAPKRAADDHRALVDLDDFGGVAPILYTPMVWNLLLVRRIGPVGFPDVVERQQEGSYPVG